MNRLHDGDTDIKYTILPCLDLQIFFSPLRFDIHVSIETFLKYKVFISLKYKKTKTLDHFPLARNVFNF